MPNNIRSIFLSIIDELNIKVSDKKEILLYYFNILYNRISNKKQNKQVYIDKIINSIDILITNNDIIEFFYNIYIDLCINTYNKVYIIPYNKHNIIYNHIYTTYDLNIYKSYIDLYNDYIIFITDYIDCIINGIKFIHLPKQIKFIINLLMLKIPNKLITKQTIVIDDKYTIDQLQYNIVYQLIKDRIHNYDISYVIQYIIDKDMLELNNPEQYLIIDKFMQD